MALPRRAVVVAFGAMLGGCTGPGDLGSTATAPEYVSCDPATVSENIPDETADIPDPLTDGSVTDYVERLEREIVLPPEDEISDGYVSIGTIETETVTHGYLATVPVTGGYYNEASDETSTVTVHADLGQHIATYFVNEQLVRRARDTNAELDPREHGEVVVCESG